MLLQEQSLLVERYNMIREANLFDKKPLIDAIDNMLEYKGVTDPNIINWFKTQYVRWYISPSNPPPGDVIGAVPYIWSPGDPEWAANKNDLYDFVELLDEPHLLHIIDYFDQLSPLDRSKINKEPYDVIVRKVEEWDEKLAAARSNNINRGVEGDDYDTLMKFPDGFSIVVLKSEQSYKCEGDEMGHCVGGYHKYSDKIRIYSLRDPKGAAHATIEYYIPAEEIRQIKGKQNDAPKEKYWPYLKQFISDNKLNVAEDGQNIGMIPYEGYFYFDDSDTWKRIYYDRVIPDQQNAFRQLENKIAASKRTNIGLVVDLSGLYLYELPPIDLSYVRVIRFDCSNNMLKSFEPMVMPKEVLGPFNCSHNQLDNLIGAPLEVGGEFFAHNNKLTSLDGMPMFIRKGINLRNNKLTSLKGTPNTMYGGLNASENEIETLEGSPRNIKGTLNLGNNKIQNLDGIPDWVEGNINLENNPFSHATIENYIKQFGKDNDWSTLPHIKHPNVEYIISF